MALVGVVVVEGLFPASSPCPERKQDQVKKQTNFKATEPTLNNSAALVCFKSVLEAGEPRKRQERGRKIVRVVSVFDQVFKMAL